MTQSKTTESVKNTVHKTRQAMEKAVETLQDDSRFTAVRKLGKSATQMGRRVWLAGLGTVATVDERRRRIFDGLVEAGERFEAKDLPSVRRPFRQAGDKVKDISRRVEEGVEERLSGAAQRMGVPTRHEIQQLIGRIEDLTQQVENLTQAQA